MGSVEIYGPLVPNCYAYVQERGDGGGSLRKFDISIVDKDGNVLVGMKDFSVRRFDVPKLSKPQAEERELLYLGERWLEAPCVDQAALSGNLLLIGDEEGLGICLSSRTSGKGRLIQMRYGEHYKKENDGVYVVPAGNGEDIRRVVSDLGEVPTKLVFVGGGRMFSEEDANAELERGLYTLSELIQAMMKQKPKREVSVVCMRRGGVKDPAFRALSGFCKSVHQESPKFEFRVISVAENASAETIADILEKEFGSWSKEVVEVRYEDGRRDELRLGEVSVSLSEGEKLFKESGVYVITGGVGGLGLIFARHLSEEYKAKLVLSGRRELDASIEAKLQDIGTLGGEAIYVTCDVTRREDVKSMMESVRGRYGRIDGIIHAAGVLRDSFLQKKPQEDMRAVISTKVLGALNLDLETASDDLEVFVMFASIAGVMGNVGQTDYAYGNRFLDGFAAWRRDLVEAGERRGRTVSIDWPLWAEGGMQVGEETKKWLLNMFGMRVLSTVHGVDSLERIVRSSLTSVLVMEGNPDDIKRSLGVVENEADALEKVKDEHVPAQEKKSHAGIANSDVEDALIRLCSEVLKVNVGEIDATADFAEYGVDSIMMMRMLNQIESMYGQSVDPNSMVTYPTIQAFAEYLIQQGIARASEATDDSGRKVKTDPITRSEDAVPRTQKSRTKRDRFRTMRSVHTEDIGRKIAVIGMACRFPGSPSVESFWEHLRNGDDLITEIPDERWDRDAFYSPDRAELNKSYSKWGGFIDRVDLFDAAFFGISDADAVTMDPQQRIMLELTQELLDRSGYTREEIGGTKTSLFIGAAANQYIHAHMQDLSPEIVQHIIVNNIPNMIAARISDFYDLRGGSQTIDTACSSSLVAVHEACRALRSGQSTMAIAGGVLLIIDPYFHIGFGKAEVLSDDGRSYVFDQRARGFVLGEGAGLVLLKPLEAAVRDGDQIFGVIAGSAVNNDGHTMGVTVPSMEGQEEVLRMCIEDSGVTPETIGYLEAHGTGTLLGDPIEIKAASNVFRNYTDQLQYCAVGSVKSNMGHLLTAAGIASFIKVLLAMQNEAIPPTLNCENPHPRFRFSETPFYPITELKKWEPLHGVMRAAISSFGFGGTNCHMVLEKLSAADTSAAQAKRQPLPSTVFSRKPYWLGLDIDSSDLIDDRELENEYKELFAQLRKGKISPKEAVTIAYQEDL
jgi:3-oxoacyl-(acyl-carrier-protein) synthase/NAD(P)-dependent dehydrogenase (short-subunit alcohol dehydrogenase family)/acyl carrier protein